ncbi:Adenosine/AMP deaminase, putative [Angomonas deanei]|uniref:Adenosine/AMP deaminase, putative n=1 Tax=Angomonas deanei TaxID=59799 RepID=A0A7G2C9K2_9TRYP|nr:Adenosine/AMP deaminase, putative [Angomonas deanei]
MNYTDQSIMYSRIGVYSATGHSEARRLQTEEVNGLRHVLLLRQRYAVLRVDDVNVEDVFTNKSFDESQWEYNNYYGVFLISRVGKTPEWPEFLPKIADFTRDVETARRVVSSPQLRRLALHRLSLLERKFLLHVSMNIANEGGVKEEKEWNNRDFYTAHKVDNNIQTEAGPNARTLLEFFVEKALNHGDDVVFEEKNQPVTLRQLISRYHIDTQTITVDELNHQLNTHADLHTIFLSPFNFMQGRYFAELTKRTLDIYKEDAYSFAEFRLSMLGGSSQEWYELGHWFDRYGLVSPQARCMVRFPRQYRRLRQQGVVKNFGEYLDNIFQPLWEISLHPASDTKLHYFLTHISGFDCYDDESKIDLPSQ